MARSAQQQHRLAAAAASASRWGEAYELLRAVDLELLTAEDLDLFADAAFWCCRTDEEVALRQRAFAGFVEAGEPLRAAYAAWMLSVRLGLRGQPVPASGWLQRAQRQLVDQPETVEHGYVACGEAERALAEGRPDEGVRHAARAVSIGQRFGEAELVALALSWQGLCCLVLDDADNGARCLDEAMVSVTAGELDPLYTGWIYCFAIGICLGVADLRRAGTWAQQAWDWASSLSEHTPYLGLCRIRQVEIMSLRGELVAAESEAHLACEEVQQFEPNLAGEAFYVTGEVLRRRGDLVGAETAFERARGLGHDPQPGLALVRLAQGRVAEAAGALRAADPGAPPLRRAATLSARVEVAIETGELADARAACEELARLAGGVRSDAVLATAATARGRVLLAEADAEAALRELRPAAASWRALDLACEVAQTRALVGMAMRELGDEEGAVQELRSAKQAFERLGAEPDARRVTAMLEAKDAADTPLTDREREVLRHVAHGSTNREIATALTVSEHTVARHLSNIFTKLGVSSRTAAAAYAFGHDLV
jgi:ATP/maltotriose-dependent transcriptional regulator MalT